MRNYTVLTRLARHKAQVTLYFIGGIASLIAITFIIIMIGKQFKDKTHSENAADAGALAACSVMATGFNYLSDKNGQDNPGDNGEEAQGETGNPLQPPSGELPGLTSNVEMQGSIQAASQKRAAASRSAQPLWNAQSLPYDKVQAHQISVLKYDAEESERDIEEYARRQREDFHQQGDNFDGQNGSPDNYYSIAVSQGYKMNFQNSGIHHRLGRHQGKDYSDWFQTKLAPGAVQSGEPVTYSWVDGAGRFHMVTAIIEIEPTNNWNVETAQDTTEQSQEKFRRSAATQDIAMRENAQAQGLNKAGIPWDGRPLGVVFDVAARIKSDAAEEISTDGANQASEAINRIHGSRDNVITNTRELEERQETPKQINDVYHSRMVYSSNFQFHMGSPIKSMFADIDQMTFYIPVQSMAIASFNYNLMGNIRRPGRADRGSDPRHECGLIAAF